MQLNEYLNKFNSKIENNKTVVEDTLENLIKDISKNNDKLKGTLESISNKIQNQFNDPKDLVRKELSNTNSNEEAIEKIDELIDQIKPKDLHRELYQIILSGMSNQVIDGGRGLVKSPERFVYEEIGEDKEYIHFVFISIDQVIIGLIIEQYIGEIIELFIKKPNNDTQYLDFDNDVKDIEDITSYIKQIMDIENLNMKEYL